jgi:lysophospholipase L1-like esterase
VAVEALLFHSKFYWLLKDALLPLQTRAGSAGALAGRTRCSAAETAENLAAIRHEAVARGVPVLFVRQVNAHRGSPERGEPAWIVEDPRPDAVPEPSVALTSLFAERGADLPAYLQPDGVHATPLGNQLIARTLAEHLLAHRGEFGLQP